MIVNVVVPILRHSLSPDKIAAHMNALLDPDRDQVTSVTVCTDEGDMETWALGSVEKFS
jgi:hypothetical protein